MYAYAADDGKGNGSIMKSKQMKFAMPAKKLWSDTNNIGKQMFLRGFAPPNPLGGLVA